MARFTMDVHPAHGDRCPTAGDLVVSARACYRVTDARPVESRVWGNRWALTLRRLPLVIVRDGRIRTDLGQTPQLDYDDGFCWYTTRYRKGETPADYFAGTS